MENQGGDKYIALEAVKKWNGQLPTYIGAGSPIPFLSTGK